MFDVTLDVISDDTTLETFTLDAGCAYEIKFFPSYYCYDATSTLLMLSLYDEIMV